MEELDKVFNAFENNIKEIDQLNLIGNDISEILLGMLNSLKNENNNIS